MTASNIRRIGICTTYRRITGILDNYCWYTIFKDIHAIDEVFLVGVILKQALFEEGLFLIFYVI